MGGGSNGVNPAAADAGHAATDARTGPHGGAPRRAHPRTLALAALALRTPLPLLAAALALLATTARAQARAQPANTTNTARAADTTAPPRPPLSASEGTDVQRANSPLQPSPALDLNNYFGPSQTLQSVAALDDWSDSLILRGLLPIPSARWFPFTQLVRASLPITSLAAVPLSTQGRATGLGDLQVFDILMMHFGKHFVGAGPLGVFPTATGARLGDGRWELGAALAYATTAIRGVVAGGLAQFANSLGDASRPGVSVLTVQPVATAQLFGPIYVRSTAVWRFDLRSGDYAIPVGLGIGVVIPAKPLLFNFFVEPQYTLFSHGAATPLQTLVGFNTQLAP